MQLPCPTDSIKNVQQKLAGHQNSYVLLRAQLVGEQKAIVIRPWSCQKSKEKPLRIKCQMTIFDKGLQTISGGRCCAAVDLGIGILLLPSALLHWQIHDWAINRLRQKEWNWQMLLANVDFNSISVARQSVLIRSLDRLRLSPNGTSDPPQKTRSTQLDALLLSTRLFLSHWPRLKTKVVPRKVKEKTANFSNLWWTKVLWSWTSAILPLILNGMASARLISPSLPFALFGRYMKHQNQLSLRAYAAKSMQTHATPIQPCATCMCLPGGKAKHVHCPKNLARAFDDYFAKECYLEDVVFQQTVRNY